MTRTLAEAIEDYSDTRKHTLSPSTWEAHERQLEKFYQWAVKPANLGPYCPLEDVTDKVMTQYFNRIRTSGSASTVNNYRQYIGAFFKHCLGEGWIAKDPMRHVPPAHIGKRRSRLQLSATELQQALDTADARDRIGLALGIHTMLRAGDIAALKVGDVNLTNNTLHAYIEKTDSHDDLPITSELHAELVCWFKAYADTMGLGSWLELPNDWTLVPAADYLANNVWEPESGGRIRYKVYGRYAHNWEIVQRALTRLGHPTKFEGFHTLRRSGARLVYEAAKADGMADPIRIAQAQLGHGDQRVTERYLGLEPDKVRRDELLRGRSFLAAAVERETGATVTDLDGETLRSGGVVGL